MVKSKGPLAICTGPVYYPTKSSSSSLLSHVSNSIRVRGSSESVRRRLRRLEHKELYREQRKLFKCTSKLEQVSHEEEQEEKEKQKEKHVLESSHKEQSKEESIHDEQVNEEQPSLRREEEELEPYKQEEGQEEKEQNTEHENEHRTLSELINVKPTLKMEEEMNESSAQTPKYTPLHKLFTSFSRKGENVNAASKNEEEQKWQGSSSPETREDNESNNGVNCAKCNTSYSSYFWPSKLTRVDSCTNNNNSNKESSTENMSDNNNINVNTEHLYTNYLEAQNALHRNKYIKYRGKKEFPPDATFMAIWDLHSHDHIAFIVPNKIRKRRQRMTKEQCDMAAQEVVNKSRNTINNESQSDHGNINSTNSSKLEGNDTETIYLENAYKFELLSPVLPYIVE